eukprot:226616-Alexandrium_andersonii.AAC.1
MTVATLSWPSSACTHTCAMSHSRWPTPPWERRTAPWLTCGTTCGLSPFGTTSPPWHSTVAARST